MSDQKDVKLPHYVKFLIAGISGCGTVMILHPLDVVKSRMQVSGEGGKVKEHKTSLHAIGNIVKTEGFLSLYSGFTANIARQVCYTMTRFGIYQVLMEDFAKKSYEGLGVQVFSSSVAGLVASFISTPTDLALIRMAIDAKLPPDERRRYKNVFNAIYRIKKEEGIKALWTGAVITVMRATLGTVTQFVSYVQSKHFILKKELMSDGVGLHFVSSVLAGFFYAFCTVPLDVAKTRIQNMKYIDGKPEYRGILDVYVKLLKLEGVFALWKGFTPYYSKIAPNTILLFVFNEKLFYYYKKYVLGDVYAKGGF